MGALGGTEWCSLKCHSRVTSEHLLFLSFSSFIILSIGMTNTASQYYCARGDLHFPADNPQMKSMTVFTHRILPAAPFLSNILHPHPKLQLLRPPNPCQRKLAISFYFFQLCFFRLVSLERCSERDSGGQPGREGILVVPGEEPGEQGGAGHISPQTLERRSSKALDNKWIQLFTFVILQ